jgi:type I restriction enzyme, S subunit
MNILQTLRTIVKDQVDGSFVVNQLKYSAKAQFSSVDKRVFDDETPVSLCNYVDVYYNDTITHQIEFMKGSATANEIERFNLQEGDVIITKDSESWDDIAVPAYVSFTADDILCGYHLAQIRPDIRGLNGKYLFYLLSSSLINYQFRVASTGVTRYGLGKYWLDNAIIPIPDIEIQVPIAAYLDTKTTQIDALIAKKQRQIELLKEKRSALITQAVTKGLDPSVNLKDSGVEWIGEVPEHWVVLKFGYVTSLMTCGHAATPEYVDSNEGVPFLSAQNIKDETISFAKYNYIPHALHNSLTKHHRVEKGDLLQVRVGGSSTIGQTAVMEEDFECSIYVSLSHIKVNESVSPYFISYLCNSVGYRRHTALIMKKGAGVANFNVSDQIQIRIPLPPIHEQKLIISHLKSELGKIDMLNDQIQQSIDLLVEYRSSLISEAVTGKLHIGETS